MSSPPPKDKLQSNGSSNQNVRAILRVIDGLAALDKARGPSAAETDAATLHAQAGAPTSTSDPEYFPRLAAELQRLHVCVRARHSAARLQDMEDPLHPEYAHDFERLREEHSMILGQIDRVVRLVESIADRPMEDREVFYLRIREMIATLRRHEAEEDRLQSLAVWHDVGGES